MTRSAENVNRLSWVLPDFLFLVKKIRARQDLIPEVKQFLRADIQRIADIENHIQRNSAVSSLYAAHVGAADVHQLCQSALRKSALFAVICDIQPQIPVFFVLLFFHSLTPE